MDLTPARTADALRLRMLWAELDERAERHLAAAGFSRAEVTARYQVNLRYPGQNWSLAIDAAIQCGASDLSFASDALPGRVIELFHARHEDEYGHARLGEEPEITGVRLLTHADTPKPVFGGGQQAPRREAEPASLRSANLGDGFKDTAIFHGPSLAPGDVIRSPAIIEETFTTIVVYPGWEASLDDAGDYVLTRSG